MRNVMIHDELTNEIPNEKSYIMIERLITVLMC